MKFSKPLYALFERARVPYAFMKRGGPAELAYLDTQIEQLGGRRAEVVASLKENVQFEQILPEEEHRDLHDALFKNERVHRLPSVEELVKQRVGHTSASKRCFARVNRNEGAQEVTTGIFVAMREINPEGEHFSYDDISGNINSIKNAPITDFNPAKGATVEAILYTISGQHPWDKGGRPLAAQVHEYLYAEAAEKGYNLILSTLSPVRDFTTHLQKREGFENLVGEDKNVSDDFMLWMQKEEMQHELKHRLLRYLILEKDPVMNFHLGNGAYIGDIKFNTDNKQDWVMVNYVYPESVEQLKENQQAYRSGQTLLAPHLHDFLGEEHKVLEGKTKPYGHTPSDDAHAAENTAG